jgi:hypothetical protein
MRDVSLLSSATKSTFPLPADPSRLLTIPSVFPVSPNHSPSSITRRRIITERFARVSPDRCAQTAVRRSGYNQTSFSPAAEYQLTDCRIGLVS